MARTPTQADDDRTATEKATIMADIYKAAANSLESFGYDATGSASYNRRRRHDHMMSTARSAFKMRDDATAFEFASEYIETFDKLTRCHESASGNYAKKASAGVLRSLAAGLRGFAKRAENSEDVPGEEHREAIHALAREGMDAMAVILCEEYEGVGDEPDAPEFSVDRELAESLENGEGVRYDYETVDGERVTGDGYVAKSNTGGVRIITGSGRWALLTIKRGGAVFECRRDGAAGKSRRVGSDAKVARDGTSATVEYEQRTGWQIGDDGEA